MIDDYHYLCYESSCVVNGSRKTSLCMDLLVGRIIIMVKFFKKLFIFFKCHIHPSRFVRNNNQLNPSKHQPFIMDSILRLAIFHPFAHMITNNYNNCK